MRVKPQEDADPGLAFELPELRIERAASLRGNESRRVIDMRHGLERDDFRPDLTCGEGSDKQQA